MKFNKKNERTGYRFFRYPPLLFLFLLLLAYVLWPIPTVALAHGDTVFYRVPVERGERFSITYVHSVMKTPVTDVFSYDKIGRFVLERTEYQSFGAGLPTENFGEFEHVNGIYINGGIDRPLDVIRQRVGRFANHRVLFEDGTTVTLDEYVPGGELVTLSPSYQLRILTYFSKGDETID